MRNNKKTTGSVFLYIFFGALIFIGIYQIATYGWQSLQSGKKAEEISEQVVTWQTEQKTDSVKSDTWESQKEEQTETKEQVIIPESIDFAKLQEQNAEVVAWLYCPNTVINYPVVQTKDNETYLYRDLSLNDSRGGTLFVEAANQGDFSDWNTIIYGHNMKNGSMFHTVTEYMDAGFYEEHPLMYLYTPQKRYEIHLVAGCVLDAGSQWYQNLQYSGEGQEVLNQLCRRSTFSSDETVDKESQIVTLSTCVYDYEDARYVLIGKLVEW